MPGSSPRQAAASTPPSTSGMSTDFPVRLSVIVIESATLSSNDVGPAIDGSGRPSSATLVRPTAGPAPFGEVALADGRGEGGPEACEHAGEAGGVGQDAEPVAPAEVGGERADPP